MRRGWLLPGAFCTAAALYVLFCLYSRTMPRCVFKWITGWDCPGCGSQRAVRALFAGHPWEAWSYNLLLPFIMVYLLLLLILPSVKGTGAKRVYGAVTSAPAVWILLSVVVVWWIVRNICGV